MRMMLTLACAGVLLWIAPRAEAQLLPHRRAATPAPSPSSSTQPSERRTEPSAHADMAGGEGGGQGHFFRGSSWVGMTIWDAQNQQVGVVRDILFDTSGRCIEDVVLDSPTLGSQWTVVPYDVFRFSLDDQQHNGRLVLNLPIERLRGAPHFDANRWEMIQSPQFYTQVQHFSQGITRTAARPSQEGSEDSEGRAQQHGQARTDRRDDAHMDAKRPADTQRHPQAPAGSQRDSKTDGARGEQLPAGQSQGGQSQGNTQRQSDRSRDTQSSGGSPSANR